VDVAADDLAVVLSVSAKLALRHERLDHSPLLVRELEQICQSHLRAAYRQHGIPIISPDQ
jgi:hypothetical protein